MQVITKYICQFLALLFVACGAQQKFALPAPPLEMATDSDGRLFVSAEGVGGEGSRVLRLSRDLLQEDVLQLPPDVGLLRFALTSDKLVACFTNGSCSVYNSSDLQAGAQLTVEDVSLSSSNVALFTAPVSGGGDSFYAASFGSNFGTRQVRLVQYGLAGDVNRSSNFDVLSSDTEINFLGGFVSNNSAYFVAAAGSYPIYKGESDPYFIRILRVCDTSDESGFPAVYEAKVDCGQTLTNISALAMHVARTTNSDILVWVSIDEPISFGWCSIFLSDVDFKLDTAFANCSAANSTDSIPESLFSDVTNCQEFSVSKNNALSF